MAANDWSERTRMIVTIAVVLVVNAALGGGFYYIHGEWQKLEKEHKALLGEKKQLEEFVKQGDTKTLELKQLTERFKEQERQLPEQDEVAQLSLDVQKVSNDSKCALKSFIASGTSGGGDFSASYTRQVWRTKFEGDFMGWCKLMNKLEEEFPRFLAFEGLSIMPKNSGVVLSGSQHEINVDLVTYKYNRPQQ
ncbi:MAG TPA: type 4a pilus biogenesis protein PilO [Planctomycetota bacterium]|nr:type 4a pilus biogenesis protein PilO [Planctomycetota bacterium]